MPAMKDLQSSVQVVASAVAPQNPVASVLRLSFLLCSKHPKQLKLNLFHYLHTYPKMLSATKSTIARPQVASRQRTVSVRAQAPQVRRFFTFDEI